MTTTRWSLNVLHINLGFGKFDLIHHHKQVRFLFFMHYDNGLIVTTFAVLDISIDFIYHWLFFTFIPGDPRYFCC